jgi:hypothetical protein
LGRVGYGGWIKGGWITDTKTQEGIRCSVLQHIGMTLAHNNLSLFYEVLKDRNSKAPNIKK